MPNKVVFVITTISIVLAINFLLFIEKEIAVKEHLKKEANQIKLTYNAIEKKHKKIADIIFKTHINKKEITSLFQKAITKNIKQKNNTREKLYLKLKETYQALEEYDIKQLHFHLPNNESFLRFHKPHKFGDNLTTIRETVSYVNKNKKPIHGFEEGRIYNGYRYVFPLFDKKKNHIGSVEVSFNTKAFSKVFYKEFNKLNVFLIPKKLVRKKVFKAEYKNYKSSHLKDFYIEKDALDYLGDEHVQEKFHMKISKKDKDFLNNKALKNKVFTTIGKGYEIILIPIENPISKKTEAVFLVRNTKSFYDLKIFHYQIMAWSSSLLIIIISFLLYKNKIAKHKLIKLNKNLKKEVSKKVKELREKDKIIFKKSKDAAMGEMIDAIGHQWMSPLSVIRLLSESIHLDLKMGTLDEKETIFLTKRIGQQVDHLVETIEEFRNFFRLSSKTEYKNLYEVIHSVQCLMKDELIRNNIELKIIGDQKISVSLIPNQFKHVIINFITNSRDAFFQNEIKQNKTIECNILRKENIVILEVLDNAGGIPSHVLPKIFEPNFTTKSSLHGTGIGLYMCKQILEKIDCSIEVFNKKEGACFRLIFKNETI